ncbi:uncharacterized protein LOC143247215 isoform X4 [Tachypleus tridentatus]|uniref:uncharacterized protein LOC143247215 isoform X4 n=1 Tax=Tachypleus tridentatus TaxID=6853 RepID=UPI003FD4C4CC
MKISADCIDQDCGSQSDEGQDENGVEIIVKYFPENTNSSHVAAIIFSTEMSWEVVKKNVLSKCGLTEMDAAVFSYIDDEMDEVMIDSDLEFHEALRVSSVTGNKLQLYIKANYSQRCNTEVNSSLLEVSPPKVCQDTEEFVILNPKDNPVMVGKTNDDSVNVPNAKKEEHLPGKLDTSPEPPPWFVLYMNQFQEELTSKITKQVVRKVTKSLAGVRLMTQPESQKESNKSCENDTKHKDSPVHVGIICDSCKKVVQGVRFKCWNCPNYDLCEKCESLPNIHDEDHLFLNIKKPRELFQLPQDRNKKYFRTKQQLLNLVSTTNICDRYNLHRNLESVARGSGQSKREKKVSKMMKKLEKYRFMDAYFLEDETIPDGTRLQPGTKFVKRWRVQNTGTKPWTAGTVLKYCWGTMGLVPSGTKVSVPPLEPGEEGTLAVQFTAPLEPGHYQSHWRLYHHGRGFGHRMWCKIEVDKLNNLEPTQKETQEKRDVSHIADVLSNVEKKRENEPVIKPAVVSHTGTPNNTPFGTHPVTPNQIPSTPIETPQCSHPGTPSQILLDEEESSSIVSLCSSESDTEFVVVPMPPCFNLSKPFLTSDMWTSSFAVEAEEKNQVSTNKTSISIVCPSESKMETVTNEDDHISYFVMEDKTMSLKTGVEDKLQEELLCHHVTSVPDSDDPDINIIKNQVLENTNLSQSVPVNIIVEKVGDTASKNQGEATKDKHNQEQQPDTTVAAKVKVLPSSTSSTEKSIQVLPEALVTGALSAAACICNTARAVFTGMNESAEQSWTSLPQNWPPQLPAQPLTPMLQLGEMGFFNQELNQQLLHKHGGDLNAVISELINLEDNEWFQHRHVQQSHLSTRRMGPDRRSRRTRVIYNSHNQFLQSNQQSWVQDSSTSQIKFD